MIFKVKHKLPAELNKKLTVSFIFFCMFIVFSLFAVTDMRHETEFAVSDYSRGIDIVFAIDVSRSMDINDAKPGENVSRLQCGLSIIKGNASLVSGARFAVVIGRDRGYLAVPLVNDSEAAVNFLESIDVSSMTGRSTNLESLVESAADTFLTSSAEKKVIVLVSDGESHSGVLRNAVNRCVREGIVITAVATGSDEGRPVLSVETHSVAAVSRRDAVVMRNAAERTGGLFIDGSRTNASSMLSNYLLSHSQETNPAGGGSSSRPQRTFFIVLAIIAYGAYKFIPRLSMRKRMSLVSLAVIVFFLSSCSEGKLLLLEANYLISRGRYDEAVVPSQKALNYENAAPYAEYSLGLTFHSLDDDKAALQRYSNSQRILDNISVNEHRELRYRNYYNSGIIYFDEGNFNSAAEAFKEALRIDPKKMDAKRNLEISLMSIQIEAERNNNTETRSETREILFDYLRQHEQNQWKSREWMPEEQYTGPDY
jgi:Ca-activated chloride channel family protein